MGMDSEVIVALITGLCAVAGNYLISRKKSCEDEIRDAQREQKQCDRLDNIEHKIDIHNGYAEKLGDISKSMVAMQKDIEYLKKGAK